MYHWSIVEEVYLYDGTLEGLLTIAYKCFKEKKIPIDVVEEKEYIQNLLDIPVVVPTNLDDSQYIVNMIRDRISDFTLYYVYTAFLSGNKKKELPILHYIIYAFKHGKRVNFMKSIDCVIEVQRLCQNVKYEAHRFSGFIRFAQMSNNFLYAEYESDNDILEFLADHFSSRLSQEIWMIHDKGRMRIALYNRKEFIVVDSTTMDLSMVENEKEDEYLKLWKDYFKNIAIKERENKRCQRSFMPKKYWKYLPETQE